MTTNNVNPCIRCGSTDFRDVPIHEIRLRMRGTAMRLREEDAKRWTQAAVAVVLGVARETVRNWFTTNGPEAKGSKPDGRVKLSPDAKAKVVEEVWIGASRFLNSGRQPPYPPLEKFPGI